MNKLIYFTIFVLSTALLSCEKREGAIFPVSKQLGVAVENIDKLPVIQGEVLDGENRRIASKKIKYNSLAKLNYKILNVGGFGVAKKQLDITAQAFQFTTGKSYFSAYELPDVSQPYNIILRSYPKGRGVVYNRSAIFYPMVLLLDASYKIIKLVDPKLQHADPYHYDITGKVMIDDADVKYAIVLTTDETLMGNSVMLSARTDTRTYITEYFKAVRPHSPEGSVKVFIDKK